MCVSLPCVSGHLRVASRRGRVRQGREERRRRCAKVESACEAHRDELIDSLLGDFPGRHDDSASNTPRAVCSSESSWLPVSAGASGCGRGRDGGGWVRKSLSLARSARKCCDELRSRLRAARQHERREWEKGDLARGNKRFATSNAQVLICSFQNRTRTEPNTSGKPIHRRTTTNTSKNTAKQAAPRRLFGLLGGNASVLVDDVHVELSRALDNRLAVKGGHIVRNLRAVPTVVHHEQVKVGDVVHDKLEETVGEEVAGLLVGPVADVGVGGQALELPAEAAINTPRLPPRLLLG